MDHALDHIVEKYRQAIVDETVRLIRYQSVKSEPEGNMPYGGNINECLAYALSLCDRLGFRTKYCDGYAGWAETGSGEEILGILVHLDVVPAGNGWKHDPFAGEIDQGRIYGRGTIDDKGPAVAAIYGVKALMDSGMPLARRVRIIFGTDEENDWGCMDHYQKTEQLPALGFAPDAEYPVIYAEKGVLFATLSYPIHGGEKESIRIDQLRGGQRANMVPDECSVELSIPEGMEQCVQELYWKAKSLANAEAGLTAGKMTLKTTGLVAHGSTPEQGDNAITSMMELLGLVTMLEPSQEKFVAFYNQKIGRRTDGSGMAGKVWDEPSGSMVLNAGVIEWTGETVALKINIRYPVTYSGKQMEEMLREAIRGTGFSLDITLNSEPLYLEKESEIVSVLLDVYHGYCPDHTRPIAIGGGTYARSIPNAVAFGPVFPGQKELAHCPDEFISVDDLIKNAKIYAEAVRKLSVLD